MPRKFDIPGQEIILNDGNLNLQRSNPNPKIAVLGTGTRGPRGLTQLVSTQVASTLFGPGSEIARKASEVFAGFGPAANVWAYRLGGIPLSLTYADSFLGTGSIQGFTSPVLVHTTSVADNIDDPTDKRMFAGGYDGLADRKMVSYKPAAIAVLEFTAPASGPPSAVTIATPFFDSTAAAFKVFIVPKASAFQANTNFITDANSSPLNTLVPDQTVLDDIINDNGILSPYLKDSTTTGPAALSFLNLAPNSWPAGAGTGSTTTDIDVGAAPLGLTIGLEYVMFISYNVPENGALDQYLFMEANEYEDPITNEVVSAFEYDLSAAGLASEPFYNYFLSTFSQEETGFSFETVDGNDYLADRIGVLLDTATGILKIYDLDLGSLLWSNDPLNPIDLGVVDVDITGDLTSGNFIQLNASEVDERITIGFDDPLYVPTPAIDPQPVAVSQLLLLPVTLANMFITESDSETGMTKRSRYEELFKAYKFLLYGQMDAVVPANAYVDDPNVAYYFDVTDFRHNPTGNENVLGWLRTVEVSPGQYHFEWSEETSAAGRWADASGRLGDEYHEVSFGYELSRFAQEATLNGNITIGVIGTNKPASTKLSDLKRWIGLTPKFNEQGVMTISGTGLLGNPYVVGMASTDLNILVRERDVVIGSVNGERVPGFFATDSDEYDGNVQTDKNGFPIDMGKFVGQVSEWPVFTASDGSAGIQDSMDAFYAGFMFSKDSKISPTSKKVNSVRSLFQLGLDVEEALVAAKYVFLSNRGERGTIVVDSPVMATSNSDWTRTSTIRIIKDITDALTDVGRSIEGTALSDPERIAFNAKIDEVLKRFKKGGYLNKYDFAAVQTKIGSKLGNIKVKLALDVPTEVRIITWDTDLT